LAVSNLWLEDTRQKGVCDDVHRLFANLICFVQNAMIINKMFQLGKAQKEFKLALALQKSYHLTAFFSDWQQSFSHRIKLITLIS
jgi:hypothetical protein